jgi:hypothetical protein
LAEIFGEAVKRTVLQPTVVVSELVVEQTCEELQRNYPTPVSLNPAIPLSHSSMRKRAVACSVQIQECPPAKRRRVDSTTRPKNAPVILISDDISSNGGNTPTPSVANNPATPVARTANLDYDMFEFENIDFEDLLVVHGPHNAPAPAPAPADNQEVARAAPLATSPDSTAATSPLCENLRILVKQEFKGEGKTAARTEAQLKLLECMRKRTAKHEATGEEERTLLEILFAEPRYALTCRCIFSTLTGRSGNWWKVTQLVKEMRDRFRM